MPVPLHVSRPVRKWITPNPRLKSPPLNLVLPMAVPPPSLPSPLHQVPPRQSSRPKGTWPLEFRSHPKANSPAFPEEHQTESPLQTEVLVAHQAARGEPQRAPASEKRAWTSASAADIHPQTTEFPARVGLLNSVYPVHTHSSSNRKPTPKPTMLRSEPVLRISLPCRPALNPSRSSPLRRSTKCSSTCPT